MEGGRLSYFNVRSKTDTGQLNLPHGTKNKKCKNGKITDKKVYLVKRPLNGCSSSSIVSSSRGGDSSSICVSVLCFFSVYGAETV